MKDFLLFFFLAVFSFTRGYSQVICIWCYDQKETISNGTTNLLINGGFEVSDCGMFSYICPSSTLSSICSIDNWVCTGGGPMTYASILSSASTIVVEGNNAVYLGNAFCQICSDQPNDTSCLVSNDCFIPNIPDGFPLNSDSYGGVNGVSISQTVGGLTIGGLYFLEFWSGGEGGGFNGDRVFGVDIGFGYHMLSNTKTDANSTDVGKRYLIEFKATSTSHTFKFTNWGHCCSSCTEAIFDDVKLYVFSEVSPTVVLCDQSSIVPPSKPSIIDTEIAIDEFFIPNVFTPNGEEGNEFFTIQYNGEEDYRLIILNRWGQQIFISENSNLHWNGLINEKNAAEGVYFYKLELGDSVYNGYLTLLR